MAVEVRQERRFVRASLAWLLVALWVALIFGVGSRREATAVSMVDLLLSWLPALGPAGARVVVITFRKAVHLGTYGILAGMVLRALVESGASRTRAALAVGLGLVLAVAAADEAYQLRLPGRTGSLGDVAIDLLGAAVVAAWWAWRGARAGGAQGEQRRGARRRTDPGAH